MSKGPIDPKTLSIQNHPVRELTAEERSVTAAFLVCVTVRAMLGKVTREKIIREGMQVGKVINLTAEEINVVLDKPLGESLGL